jgi:hypothetical protein
MNILVIVLIGIVGIVALFLLLALFTKKGYTIEREIIIAKSKQTVFDHIKFLKNQDNFSKWATMDPEMKKEYKGTDGTVGFLSSWDSENKKVGKGEQTIIKISEGESIDFDIHFIKPFEGKAIATMTTELVSDNQTKVRWSISSGMKYPMNIMLLIMNMEKMIGDDLLTGLQNLKEILEK